MAWISALLPFDLTLYSLPMDVAGCDYVGDYASQPARLILVGAGHLLLQRSTDVACRVSAAIGPTGNESHGSGPVGFAGKASYFNDNQVRAGIGTLRRQPLIDPLGRGHAADPTRRNKHETAVTKRQ